MNSDDNRDPVPHDDPQFIKAAPLVTNLGLKPSFLAGETKANRDNPTFKSRANSLSAKEKTFSNRNKNTVFPLLHFRHSASPNNLCFLRIRFRFCALGIPDRLRKGCHFVRRPLSSAAGGSRSCSNDFSRITLPTR
jgi:hypothetical protein